MQLAQPIRLLLEYTGTKYEEKFYKCGPAPDFDKSCWFDNKFSLSLDFPNVSLIIIGCIYYLAFFAASILYYWKWAKNYPK